MRPAKLFILACAVASAFAAVVTEAAEIIYRIGAVYQHSDEITPLAFRLSVRAANAMLRQRGRLSGGREAIQLEPLVRLVPDSDPLAVGLEVCRLLAQGVVALAGPSHRPNSGHAAVHSRAGLHAVPHVLITPGAWWNTEEAGRHHFAVNTHPSYASLGGALLALVRRQEEENEPNEFRFAVVYSDREALLKYERLFNSIRTPTLIRQWKLQAGTYEYVMKYFNKLGQFNFLVDIPASQLMNFFQTASCQEKLFFVI